MTSVCFADVVNAADVLMTDLTGYAHFAVKARERSAIAEEMFRQKLERDRLTEFQIVGAIDLAHAAFAEQADDPVAFGKDCSGNKARVVERIEGN